MNTIENIKTLSEGLAKLSTKDQEFARSLLSSQRTRGRLSDKQAHWVGVLAKRATQGDAKPVELGDLSRVITLLDTAATNGLKRPRITLRISDSLTVKLKIAGPTARVPGSLNVVEKTPFYSETQRPAWYGRITRAGVFEPSRSVEIPPELVAKLQALAADPAKAAADHGHLTGSCCFCSLTLTDARSVTVGYGRICADKYSLPWGDVAQRAPEPVDEPQRAAALSISYGSTRISTAAGPEAPHGSLARRPDGQFDDRLDDLFAEAFAT